MNRSLLRLGVLGCIGSLVSCSTDVLGSCPATGLLPAVEVEVRDSVSDVLLTPGSRGAVRDGEYVDSLRPWRYQGDTVVTLGGAFDRPGTYDVTVAHPGYETWRYHDVQIANGSCGAGTTRLTARLQASAGE